MEGREKSGAWRRAGAERGGGEAESVDKTWTAGSVGNNSRGFPQNFHSVISFCPNPSPPTSAATMGKPDSDDGAETEGLANKRFLPRDVGGGGEEGERRMRRRTGGIGGAGGGEGGSAGEGGEGGGQVHGRADLAAEEEGSGGSGEEGGVQDHPQAQAYISRSSWMSLLGEDDDEPAVSSYTLSSPLRKPFIPDELSDPAAHPEIFAAFQHAKAQYRAKLEALYNLFPFDFIGNWDPSCLFCEPNLLPIRELAKNAVLRAAKSVVRLSSSFDGKPMTSCCGLWVEWNVKSKTGVVFTTAHIIRSKHPTVNQWKGKDGYNDKANVVVHLRDDTTAEARLLYYQEHYDFAFFEVRVDLSVHLPSFNDRVHWGQEVIRLGRDETMNLSITYGRVECLNPNKHERHHYMYFYHDDPDFQSKDDGGCIVAMDGKIVGLVNDHLKDSFVPSSILIKSIDLWRKFGCIPRLQLGMKFSSIKYLDPIHVDKMWRKYDIEDGLIVEEVSKESNAEKFGIQIGDIVECFNGEYIYTTIELEKMLMDRCKEHLEEGNDLNAKIDISIQLFDTVKLVRRTGNFTVDVSDHGEIVVRGTRPVTV